MRFYRWMLLPSLLFLITALPCRSSAQHKVIYSEIDGVPLVRTEGGPKYDGPLFEIEPDLILGINEGEPEWQQFWVSPLFLIAPDGRMVLIDYRRCELFIVSKEGDLLARTGGPGSGPGEFRQPWFYHWDVPGEVFLIDDRALNRLSRFSMKGEYIESLNYGMVTNRDWQTFTALGNGRYLGSSHPVTGVYVTGKPHESTERFCFLDSSLEPVEDFIELRSRVSWATGPHSGSGIPYTHPSDIAVFPDGRMLLYNPMEARLTVYSTFGEPLMHIERDWERPRVSARDKEEARNIYLEDDRPERRRLAGRIPFTSRHAAFTRAFADDRGRIWVEYMTKPWGYPGIWEPCKFDVFGPDGVWLGVQEFDFTPALIQGDYLYHRGAEEGGGPRFRRFHLRPLVPEAAGK